MLCRGLEAIDRGGLLFPGVSRRCYMLGMQQRTAKGIFRDLQDHHDHRDCSHRCITRLPERMAARNCSCI